LRKVEFIPGILFVVVAIVFFFEGKTSSGVVYLIGAFILLTYHLCKYFKKKKNS